MDNQEFQVIKALLSGDKNFWEILINVDGTIRNLFEKLEKLQKEDIIEYDGENFSVKEKEKYNYLLKDDFENEIFMQIAKERPKSLIKYFQAPLNDKSIFSRLEFIYERGDLAGKEFFVMGDDDLFSILLALTGLAKRIVVVEIDKRITSLIRQVSGKHKLNIEVIDYNCSDELPEELTHKFDVLITDPVETEKGFTAFLSRGIEAIRHPGSAYFGLTEIECSAKMWHNFQKDINNMNLIITDCLRKHSFYKNDEKSEETQKHDELKLSKEAPFSIPSPDREWYNSTFIRLQTVGKPKPIVKGKIKFDDSFYTNDDVMTVL